MRFSSLVHRIDGPGVAAWDIHAAAIAAMRRGEDALLLSVGDPDFDTPAAIGEACIEAIRQGDTHYSDIPGRPALRRALAAEMSRRSACSFGPDNIIVTAGAQNGLFAASLCLFEPGDEVIVLEPMYLTYAATFELTGARLVRVPMTAESGFRPDPAAIAAAITPRTRAILFSNPNNPTGVVLTQTELRALADLAVRHDLTVLVDEVYAGLIFEATHVAMASLAGMAERTVTIGSLSKSHAMTGWRIGWVAANPALIEHMGRLAITMHYGLPGFVQQGALAAVERSTAVTADMRERYRRRRDLVVGALAKTPGLGVLSPDAGMFVLVDVRSTGLAPLDFAWRLFREERVSTLDASAFGSTTRGFLRAAFTVGEPQLAEACRRIDGFVRRLGQPVRLAG